MELDARKTALFAIATGLAAVGAVAAPAQALAPSGGTITQITVSPTNETEGNGNGRYGPVVSNDGRYVAFWTYSPSIVAGDDNGASDVFLYDTTTHLTTIVSHTASGRTANGGSSNPAISANGKYIAFQSPATDLAGVEYGADAMVGEQIYRYSVATGRIKLVSKTPNGAIPASWATGTAISANGRYVAFSSRAHDIVPGDHNRTTDAFRYDVTTDSTIKVSQTLDGQETTKWSYASAISGNGQYVAWRTTATNMGPADTNNDEDAYVYDADAGTNTLISHDASGTAVGGYVTGISDNGQIMALTSSSPVLTPSNTAQLPLAYVYTAATGKTRLISTASTQAATFSISANGRYVAWLSYATTDPSSDIYLYDRQTKQSTALAVTPDGSPANSASGQPSVSRSGNFVGFCSGATNLVPGDTYGNSDIFLWSRTLG
jgi:Tol biopolymer transport system component